jgi:hypothetical protein
MLEISNTKHDKNCNKNLKRIFGITILERGEGGNMNCDTYVRVRCTSTFKQELKRAIREGKAKNMSELVRQAVEKMLKT